jgi:hypothetical protein
MDNIKTLADQVITTDDIDAATDKLEKASALLTTLAAAYDVEAKRFIIPDTTVWLHAIAVRDVIEAAHANLEPKR